MIYSCHNEVAGMLEFIVLGEVPGTGVVVTFSWAVAVATVVVGMSLLRNIRKERAISQMVSIEELTI